MPEQPVPVAVIGAGLAGRSHAAGFRCTGRSPGRWSRRASTCWIAAGNLRAAAAKM